MMKYLKGTVQAISQKFVSRTCHPCNRGSNKPAATGPLRKGGGQLTSCSQEHAKFCNTQ